MTAIKIGNKFLCIYFRSTLLWLQLNNQKIKTASVMDLINQLIRVAGGITKWRVLGVVLFIQVTLLQHIQIDGCIRTILEEGEETIVYIHNVFEQYYTHLIQGELLYCHPLKQK